MSKDLGPVDSYVGHNQPVAQLGQCPGKCVLNKDKHRHRVIYFTDKDGNRQSKTIYETRVRQHDSIYNYGRNMSTSRDLALPF